MRRLGRSGLIALIILLVSASVVMAITLNGVVGTWSNMTNAGTTEEYQTVGDEVQALWGTPGTQGKSGLGFTPNPTLPLDLDGEFEIGTLRHFNNPVGLPAATAVDLTTDLTFTDPSGSSSFTFTFSIEETPNAEPCPFPSTPGNPCSDKIGFPGAPPSQEIDVNGWIYRLDIVGFKASPSDPTLDYFISEEGETNTALLYGELELLRIEMDIDIKPMSCPNPFNLNKKGVLPVAILGTADFDVALVDPATVLLEGVAPLRWDLEDVGTPGDQLAGSDGIMDLTLKFDSQEIVAVLGDVSDGDVVTLNLTGNLKDEAGGTAIVGEDVVVIIKKK